MLLVQLYIKDVFSAAVYVRYSGTQILFCVSRKWIRVDIPRSILNLNAVILVVPLSQYILHNEWSTWVIY